MPTQARRTARAARRVALGAVTAVAVVACTSAPPADPAPPTPTVSQGPAARQTPETTSPQEAPETQEDHVGIEGTVVRFVAETTTIEVVIDDDTTTIRSFLDMLPMTLEFSDFGGKEKVASPTGEFDYTGAQGFRPRAGDLFSYVPWGNLGFFYVSEGNPYSDSLVRLGATDDIDRIELLDGQMVTIEIVD